MINASAVIGAPHARQALPGPADVADDELPAFVADAPGVRHATVLTSSAAAFSYDGPAITAAGRYLVTGPTRTGTGQIGQIWLAPMRAGTLTGRAELSRMFAWPARGRVRSARRCI